MMSEFNSELMENEEIKEIMANPEVEEELTTSFLGYLKKILTLWKTKPDCTEESQMDALTSDEEAKRVMRELCEENEMYYENLRNLQKAKKEDASLTDGQWLEREIDKEANALANEMEDREATSEEMKVFHRQVKEALDKEIENESAELDRIVTGIDKELKVIEGKEELR